VERRDSGLNKEEMIEAIDTELGSSIVNGTYQFKIRQYGDLFLHGHAKNTMSYLCQNLVLRKLYKNIKTIYSVQQADRNTIIKQIKLLLAENVEMRIVRLDVRHFYHSVNRDRILLKLIDDARLSYHTLTLLQSLFSNPVLSTYTGLPRGIGISAVLSELYMKYFDLDFKKIEGVYYYARFVDDIIVFCNSETSKNLALEYAREGLKEIGLELNDEKSYSLDPKQPNTVFTYLGYTFRKAGKKAVVTIAKKKINVIKTRLTKSFVRYSKDHNFEILKLRMKYLTGNCTLYNHRTLLPIKVGVYFNYMLATDVQALDELDIYYQRLLHCRTGRLGSVMALTKSNVKSLEKYSFRFGYKKHVNHHFTIDQMTKITSCWI
jgi:methyltransferase-like protein